jgi:hypothetical protein
LTEKVRCLEVAEQHRLKSQELLQQTRAADAGEAVAALTYSQAKMMLAGTIFGLLTLFAAFAAVLYARRAAVAAEGDLAHTQETAAAELRPYVFFVDGKMPVPFRSIGTLDMVLRNYGATPAWNLKVLVCAELVDTPIGDQQVTKNDNNWDELHVLPPNEDHPLNVPLRDLGAEDIQALVAGTRALLIYLRVEYAGRGIEGMDYDEVTLAVWKENLDSGAPHIASRQIRMRF